LSSLHVALPFSLLAISSDLRERERERERDKEKDGKTGKTDIIYPREKYMWMTSFVNPNPQGGHEERPPNPGFKTEHGGIEKPKIEGRGTFGSRQLQKCTCEKNFGRGAIAPLCKFLCYIHPFVCACK
jgi:hypothetical protein